MKFRFMIFCYLLICILNVTALEKKEKVIVIDDDNWSDVLENEWMLEFYAPWCPACKSLESTWEEFAISSKTLGINVGKSDVTTNPGLSGRFLVTAFPTIFHIKNGIFRKYIGSRSKEAFIKFIKEEKWNDIEPIPWWRNPSSIHMSAVSSFFKLALTIREYQDHLIQEHGIPQWASYIIFALGIIIIGTIIGIVCVCVLDLVFRPKSPLPEYILPDETNNKKESVNESKELKVAPPAIPYDPFLNQQTSDERRNNRAHYRARNIVERLFGVWKRQYSSIGSCLHTKLKNTLKSLQQLPSCITGLLN